MKKRLLAAVMSLCMIVSLLPVSAFALEDEGENPETETCICGTRCTEDNFNEDCLVCAADVLQCTGEEEQTGGEVPGEPETPGEPEEPSETEIPDETEEPGETEETGETEEPKTPANSTPTEEPTGAETAGEPVPYAEDAVYVSADNGSDDNPGTSENPFATLAKAVDAAEDGDTIYVMTDLTMTESARFWNKHLTITSFDPDEPVTLTRGTPFTAVTDLARGGYNGALIEVGGSSFNQESSLVLENIILDDAGLQGGKNYNTAEGDDEDFVYFLQAASSGTGTTGFTYSATNNSGVTYYGEPLTYQNTDIVQDAMIATYNNTAIVTLGDGAVLKNYGGMSAVRVSGGVLVMQAGSAIYDDQEFNRDGAPKVNAELKSESGSTWKTDVEPDFGPAGAIWLQGGEFVMEQGAEISNLNGRVVYADSGEVNISGRIYDITSNSEMWQGTGGYIAHLRSGANGTLGDGCDIYNTFTDKSLASGAMFNLIHEGTLEMESGARIHDWNGVGNCFFASDAKLILNGEIDHVNTNGSHILQCGNTEITVGPSADIHHNKVSYGTLYIQGGNTMDVYGKINYNYSTDRGGAIAITNHGDSFVTMYDGAEMIGNYSKETGGAILVSDGSFTMYGGTIKGNHASMDGGGVFVRQGGSFYMKGGTISGNYTAQVGGGVAFQSEEGCVEITDGTISDNYMKATLTPDADKGTCTAEGGVSNDFSATKEGSKSSITTNYKFDDGAVMANAQFFMEKYGFTIDRINGVKLGNAATACETAATTKYGVEGYGYLGTVVGSFWYQSDNNVTLDISGLENATNYAADKPLFAAIVPTNEEGTPAEGGELALFALSGGGSFRLPLSDSENGYAVVFLQEDDASSIITVIPASLTA